MRFAVPACIVGFITIVATPALSQSSMTVNTTVDEYDVAPNASCSLREAIASANGGGAFGGCVVTGVGGPYIINVGAETYTLTIAGAAEDLGATGDLDVTQTVLVLPPAGSRAIVDGGALDRVFDVHASAALTVLNMDIRNGVATADGGGIRVISAALTLEYVRLHDNATTNNGGGIFADTGVDITILDSEITDNVTDTDANGASRGGAMYIADPGAGNLNKVLIERSTLAGNFGDDFGGAISTLGTATTEVIVRNSTISGNSSNSSGGGISSGGVTTLDAVTITDNTSNLTGTFSGGGGIRRVNGTVTMRGSIVAGNDALLNECDDFSGTASGFISESGNLFGENTCLEGAFPAGNPNPAGDRVGTDAAPIDPLLGPLADNDGPTRTHALLEASLARDNGNTTLPDDQRGALRDGTPDIGSFEFGVPTAGAPGPSGDVTHSLSVLHPNPAVGTTRFTLSVSTTQHVDVSLFDITGRLVALVSDGATTAGVTHVFNVDASSLSAGVYVLRVRGEHFEESRRVVLAR